MKAEIEALHGRKAEAMRAAMQAQRRELEDICAASHMAVPPMPPASSAEAGLSGAALCAQVGAQHACSLLFCSPSQAQASTELQLLICRSSCAGVRGRCTGPHVEVRRVQGLFCLNGSRIRLSHAAPCARKTPSFLNAMQVAGVLAKVAEQVREAEDEAERRSSLLTALQDIASMRSECAWLASYEKDDGRFKVGSQQQATSVCKSLRKTYIIYPGDTL